MATTFNIKNPQLQALDDEIAALNAFALDMTNNAWARWQPVVVGDNTVGVEMEGAPPIELSNDGASTALTSGTTGTLATLTLPPGWYELTGVVVYTVTGGTVSLNYMAQGAHNVSAALPAAGSRSSFLLQAVPLISPEVPILSRRVEVAAEANWYLTARAQWGGGGTLSAQAWFRARQIGVYVP